jgi:hypothetical protein
MFKHAEYVPDLSTFTLVFRGLRSVLTDHQKISVRKT